MAQPEDDHIGESGQFINAELPNPSGAGAPPRSGRRGSIEPGTSNPFQSTSDGEGNVERGESVVSAVFRQSSHPTVAIFHVIFKLAAITSYLLLGLFTKNFVIQFVVTTTLLAFDFWLVKNVTGRLLVGLRWWHEVAEDGITQQWRFETIYERENLNVTDGRIFWWTLYAFPVIWIVLGVVCILKFNMSYLIIVVIALVLASANIVGYYKCSKDATEQIKNYIGKTVIGHAMDRSGFGRLSGYI